MTVGNGESNKFEIETGTVLSVLGVKVKSNGRGHGKWNGSWGCIWICRFQI